jgi:hypothetical protein
MVLTKFIVRSASHQANPNSSLSLSQNGEKLVHELTFELERIENFHQMYEIYTYGGLSFFLNYDLLNE